MSTLSRLPTSRSGVPSGLLLFLIVTLTGCSTSSYFGRFMRWRGSDIGDHRRFPAHRVENAPPAFHFVDGGISGALEEIEYEHDGGTRVAELGPFLQSNESTAFIVIRRDTILYEGYFSGYHRSSINTSFSVAKSVTSLLVGIALDEGHFRSLDDPITEYVPELAERDERFGRITLGHLLSMRSGIAFADHDFPWGDKPKAYYDPHLRERVLNLDIEEEPGRRFVYNTYNPILLGVALERATGRTVASYFEEKLWKRLGMEFDASWSIDSDEGQMAKMESGINARAVDFAKIGRLVLQGGRWRGEQIISSEWIDRSTRIDEANRVPEIGENIHYQHGWWIHSPTAEERYSVGAWGHLGQYVYLFPEEEIVMVRFGKKPGDVIWPRFFQSVADALADGGGG